MDLTRGIILGNTDTGFEDKPPRWYILTVRGKHCTFILVLTTNGIENLCITESSIDGDVFLDFIRRCILPIFMPFNGTSPNLIVIMDNASIHRTDPVLGTYHSCWSLCKFLPLDLNPIDKMFAEVKYYL